MSISSASDAAIEVLGIQSRGESSDEELWRFGILQLLDDYESVLAHAGVEAASQLLRDEPPKSGHSGIDAALAALVAWLADRDGWRPPNWVWAADRVARPWWFVTPSSYGRAWAMVQSPAQFRIRGVFITDTALMRV